MPSSFSCRRVSSTRRQQCHSVAMSSKWVAVTSRWISTAVSVVQILTPERFCVDADFKITDRYTGDPRLPLGRHPLAGGGMSPIYRSVILILVYYPCFFDCFLPEALRALRLDSCMALRTFSLRAALLMPTVTLSNDPSSPLMKDVPRPCS